MSSGVTNGLYLLGFCLFLVAWGYFILWVVDKVDAALLKFVIKEEQRLREFKERNDS